jgi:endonuclease/exonuclease/phosphatase (EEP) superfamily protein YafD
MQLFTSENCFMIVLELFLFTFLGYLVLTTFLSLLKTEVWWIRVLDFPRLQSFWLQLLFGAVYIITLFDKSVLDYVVIGLTLLCVSLQGYMIVPYTFLVKKQVLPSATSDHNKKFTVLISNVLMTNRNSGKLLEEIKGCDPDIIFCVETDKWWAEQLSGLKEKYPYFIECPLDNTYGLLFYSKLKLINPQVKYLVQDDIPSVHADIEMKSGDTFRFYGIHPRPPAPDESKTSLPRDAELVLVGREVKEHGGPCIVTGDMNDVGWSATTQLFQKLSGMLDPRIGRGMYCTFNAKYLFFRWSLDHAFFSRHFRISSLRRLPNIGSDHFPLCFTLSYEPEKKEKQEKPEAGHKEQKEADKKLRDAGKM